MEFCRPQLSCQKSPAENFQRWRRWCARLARALCDIIIAVDGKLIHSAAQLSNIVGLSSVGRHLQITFERAGIGHTVTVEVEAGIDKRAVFTASLPRSQGVSPPPEEIGSVVLRQHGALERAVPADGQTGRRPDRAANARIDASSTSNHWCGPAGAISRWKCWRTGCDVHGAGSRYVRV
jgi:hypothetical protein